MSCEALRELFKDELDENEKIGEKRGKEAAQREIIIKMHKKGFAVEQISDLIDVSEEDVEKIIKSEIPN